MRLSKDWHVHSKYSTCGHPGADVAKVYAQAKQAGVDEFGLTDHLHTLVNIPSLEAARREFAAIEPDPSFHFGVEASCVRERDIEYSRTMPTDAKHGLCPLDESGPLALCISDELVDRLGIEYVIGGVHWVFGPSETRQKVIESYVQQYLFVIQHPLVDIVAHPWWWENEVWLSKDGTYDSFPWFDDFEIVPRSIHEEFAAAARQYNVAVEINPDGTFLLELFSEKFRRQYIEYLHMLKRLGVRFSIGTDQHEDGYVSRLPVYEEYLDRLGLEAGDLWDISESKIMQSGSPATFNGVVRSGP